MYIQTQTGTGLNTGFLVQYNTGWVYSTSIGLSSAVWIRFKRLDEAQRRTRAKQDGESLTRAAFHPTRAPNKAVDRREETTDSRLTSGVNPGMDTARDLGSNKTHTTCHWVRERKRDRVRALSDAETDAIDLRILLFYHVQIYWRSSSNPQNHRTVCDCIMHKKHS